MLRPLQATQDENEKERGRKRNRGKQRKKRKLSYLTTISLQIVAASRMQIVGVSGLVLGNQFFNRTEVATTQTVGDFVAVNY